MKKKPNIILSLGIGTTNMLVEQISDFMKLRRN